VSSSSSSLALVARVRDAAVLIGLARKLAHEASSLALVGRVTDAAALIGSLASSLAPRR
jgi:hypothetical protein